MSVEELAYSILKESIRENFDEISNLQNSAKFVNNDLREMQPYSYLAVPNEPAISPDDWDINQDFKENYL